MTKRFIVVLSLVALFLVAIGSAKYFQIQAAIAGGASFQPPPEAVTTIPARLEQWPVAIETIGTVVAVHGVTVSADLPGIVKTISFDSGRQVKVGDVLVELDTSQEQAQLAAAKAQDNLAHLNLERMRGLRETGVVSEADYDRSAAELEQADARVVEIEATIQRKTIRAPFDGSVGIRQANIGQYLKAGDPVVPLQSLDPIFVDFSVPQQNVGSLRRGAVVQATAEGVHAKGFLGTVTAIDSVVDAATRNIQVQATLANPDGQLRPGMYVEARVMVGVGSEAVTLPTSAISYAPYGDSVFVVEQMTDRQGKSYRGVRQQFVKLGGSRGDQVAVLSGVRPGEEIVSSGAFKLRNGAAVLVNNRVQPGNEAAPRPENS
jgi:membrane fusion protein, multidrug efflux system